MKPPETEMEAENSTSLALHYNRGDTVPRTKLVVTFDFDLKSE
jgi:hypothetical protein